MVARRRHRHFKTNFLAIIGVFIIIIGITFGILFMYKSRVDEQVDGLIARCVALPEDYDLVNLTGDIGNVAYSFMAPEYMDGKFEENEAGDYFYAVEGEETKAIFYVYVYARDDPSNYTAELLMHQDNSHIYYSQPMINNGNQAIYLQSKNISRVPDVITIEHPTLCGDHFEFSCSTVCDENFGICEQIFDSLRLSCLDGTPIVSEVEE